MTELLNRACQLVALVLFLGLGILANGSYFWMANRVSREHVYEKPFIATYQVARMVGAYRELASAKGWPVWPIKAFWWGAGAAIAVFVVGEFLCG